MRLTLKDGREIIDGMASWWSTIHGYNHPLLNQAAKDQIDQMSHVMFGGLTHQPAIDLATQLIDMTAEPLQHVFFADSGSISVEVAIKMAIQYFFAQGRQTKQRLLTIRGGYHGDTFGAMAVCDPVTGMHSLFSDNLPEHLFAPKPARRFHESWHEKDGNELEALIVAHSEEIAAVIIEPIVQGAGGMWFYHPNYLVTLKRLCERHNILLILDEIATGFGRTGKMFASEYAGITPDIVCVGKALTGGYMTLAATLATATIADVISRAEPGVFMHGPTFMANPLACSSAIASLSLLEDSDWQTRVANIEQQLTNELTPFAKLEAVNEVRVLGAIGVIELHKAVDMKSISEQFIDRGVWVRPFGKLLYVMPPYVISSADLSLLTTAIGEVANELTR